MTKGQIEYLTKKNQEIKDEMDFNDNRESTVESPFFLTHREDEQINLTVIRLIEKAIEHKTEINQLYQDNQARMISELGNLMSYKGEHRMFEYRVKYRAHYKVNHFIRKMVSEEVMNEYPALRFIR